MCHAPSPPLSQLVSVCHVAHYRYDLILTCWKGNPQQRSTFAQMHCHTRNLRQLECYGYASVLSAGQCLLDGGHVTSGLSGYMPTLADTMEPAHSYAALVKGHLVAGGREN